MNRWTKLAGRLYSIFLSLHPPRFRQEYADELKTVFLLEIEAASQDSGAALARCCIRELWDAPQSLFSVYLREWGSATGRPGGDRSSLPGQKSYRAARITGAAVAGMLALAAFGFMYWLLNLDNTGTFYVSASFADLDRDGDLDVVAQFMRQESELTAFGGPVLWINHGERVYERQPYPLVQGELGGWASATADIDGDGYPDILRFQGYALAIDINQQNGSFKTLYTIPDSTSNNQFGSLVVGDLNGDGWLDVLVTGRSPMALPVNGIRPPSHSWTWFNSSDDQARKKSARVDIPDLAGVLVSQAALGDLDGDGDLDIVAAVTDRSGSRVLFNDGSGNFLDSGQRLGKSRDLAAALADLDGDGDLDLLLGTREGAQAWMNDGGNFSPSLQKFDRQEARQVFLADLDSDGDVDALVGGTGQAVIWWNDGNGAFTRSGQRFSYTRRYGLGVADLDGDGWLDIWAGKYDRLMHIWYNQGDRTFSD